MEKRKKLLNFFFFSGQIGMQLGAFQALSILPKGLCLMGYVETNTDVSLVLFRVSYIKAVKETASESCEVSPFLRTGLLPMR